MSNNQALESRYTAQPDHFVWKPKKPQQKETKHLPGQHNQMSHGRGGGGVDAAGGSARQTDSPEFKAWFGDSKVVDENGEPLVVYHGTFSAFNEFGKMAPVELGYHFGTLESSIDRLDEVDSSGSQGANIKPCYLCIKNPITLADEQMGTPDDLAGALDHIDTDGKLRTAADNWAHEYDKKYEAGSGKYSKEEADKLSREAMTIAREVIEASGYDGIRYENHYEGRGSISWVAFSPTQIKSATGNRGTFDPNDPDITKSTEPSPLLSLAFDSKDPKWKREIVDRALPVLAVGMLEAMTAQMMEVGIDPRRRGTKHLPGQHNQMSHGRGGSMAADTGGNTSGGGGGETVSKSIGKYSMDRSVEAVKERVRTLDKRLQEIHAERNDLRGRREAAKPEEQWELAVEAGKLNAEAEIVEFDIRTEVDAQQAANLEGFLEESTKQRGLIQMQHALNVEMATNIREAGGDIDRKYGELTWHQMFKVGKDGGDQGSIDDFSKEWHEKWYKIYDDVRVAGDRANAAYYGDPIEVKSTGKTLPSVADEVTSLPKIKLGGKEGKEAEFMAEAEVGIKMDVNGLVGLLHDQKFKNHFHRGTDGIGKDDGRVRGEYRKHRKVGEEEKFGIPIDAKPDQRPIYGYLENPARMKTKGAELHYGNIQVVLKDDVKGRTSYTVGDSLDVRGVKAAAVAAPVKYEGRHGETTQVGLTTRDWVKTGQGTSSPNYIEAQVHGKVTLDDVKVIRIPKGTLGGSKLADLRNEGVAVEIIPPPRGVPYYNRIDDVIERRD